MLRHGSFFSGIGGFDIAAKKAGFKNVFTCEKDNFRRQFLNHISPETHNHADIDNFPFDYYKGAIDVVSGGDPCQPHSHSGKRRGTADDRFKWPQMFTGIEIIRPPWVVNENVVGTISNMVLDQKISDLESIGYTCQAYNIPAVGINADHERKRIFLVAHSQSERHQTICSDFKNRIEVTSQEEQHEISWSRLHDLRPCHTTQFEKGMDQPAIAISKDGLPTGIDKRFLQAAGNLVCPGLAYIFFNLIKQIEYEKAK